MGAKVHFIIISSLAFLLTSYAGTWDSFEMGLMFTEDDGMCYNPTHGFPMIINMEYQVPGKCATMVCHDSYIIASRDLEVGKTYQPIKRCGELTCDKANNMTVKACDVKDPDHMIGGEDLTKPYPKCCTTPVKRS